MAKGLQNYIAVNERVASATPPDLAPIHFLHVDPPMMMTETMGYIRVLITLADGRAAHGTASFDLSLTGNRAQATNPIEDCETSAVGRALAFLGYHSDKRIASREEVQEARRRSPGKAQRAPQRAPQNGRDEQRGDVISSAELRAFYSEHGTSMEPDDFAAVLDTVRVGGDVPASAWPAIKKAVGAA